MCLPYLLVIRLTKTLLTVIPGVKEGLSVISLQTYVSEAKESLREDLSNPVL